MDPLPSFPLKSRMLIIPMLAINSCMDEASADPFHLCREITVPKLTWGLLQSIEVITQLSEKPVSWFKARHIFPPTSGGAFGRGRGRANITGSFLGPTMATKWIYGTKLWNALLAKVPEMLNISVSVLKHDFTKFVFLAKGSMVQRSKYKYSTVFLLT